MEIKVKPKMLSVKTIQIGIVGSLILQPFEVLQTSMIASNLSSQNIHLSGILFSQLGLNRLIVQVIKREGFRGFFRGTTLSILKNTLSYTLFFMGIENIKPSDKHTIFVQSIMNFAIASGSKLYSSIISNPLSVLKSKMQIVGCQKYKGTWDCTVQTYQSEGWHGFFRGLVPTILRDVPYSGIQYAVYRGMLDTLGLIMHEPTQQTGAVVLCATTSSVAAILMTYPFDNIRIRQQTIDKESSFIHVFKSLYDKEGIKGYYQGYLPRLMKKGLQSGILWTVYEKVMQKNKQQQQ